MTEYDPRPMSVIREETIAAAIARKSRGYREVLAMSREAARTAPPAVASVEAPGPVPQAGGVPLPPMDAFEPDDVALPRHRVAASIAAKQAAMPPAGPNGSITPQTQLGAVELAALAEESRRSGRHVRGPAIVDPLGYEPPAGPGSAT